jgi:7,8-dihydropterin-6-yl-methyl-4-(beta-D-ribofuranosyl)aminobenzene 5'-phosphate synthase
MKKDWGFSAFIEYGGKRILFDTGNKADIFAHNVEAKGIDLKQLDFAVVSHRHGDHTSVLNHLLKVNPGVKIYAPQENFGVFGATLPGTFYKRNLQKCDISTGSRPRRFVSAVRGLKAISPG